MNIKRLLVVIYGVVLLELLSNIPAQADEKSNSIGMKFVLIPAGTFIMGADKNFEEVSDDEMPQHRVTISKPFYLGKYEVIQGPWMAVMDKNTSIFKGNSNPVEQVSWDDVQIFIKKLNQKEGTDKYHLPRSVNM